MKRSQEKEDSPSVKRVKADDNENFEKHEKEASENVHMSIQEMLDGPIEKPQPQKVPYKPPQPVQPPQTVPKLTRRPLSLWDVEPLDDVARVVGEYLKPYIGEEGLEIEAKLGVVTEKFRGERVYLDIDTEAVLKGDPRFGFESNMTLDQHRVFNQLLNHQVTSSAKPDYRGPPIRYKHTYEIDEFFEDTTSRVKVRRTKDEKTGQIVNCITKQRISNLNIFNPDHSLDYRISVNLELPFNLKASTVEVGAERARRKDRMSYTYDCFSIDLTQVHNLDNAGKPNPNQPPSHELEVEFIDPNKYLGREIKAMMEGDKQADKRYHELIKAFLNNVRILARHCPPESNARPGQRVATTGQNPE